MRSFVQHSFASLVWLSVIATGVAAEKENWQKLFNGKNLDGFYVFLGSGPRNVDSNKLVQIENGVLYLYKGKEDGSKQMFGYISTEKDYSDYHLRFEYKWGTNRFGSRAQAKRDSGVIYHFIGEDRVWPTGVECQVQEGDVGDIFTVNTRVTATVAASSTNIVSATTTNAQGKVSNSRSAPKFLELKDGGVPFVQGASSGIRRVVRNPMMEREGWNVVEVIVRGDEATHIVNGKVNNLASEMRQWIDGQWQPLTKGRILFQLEGAEVSYRNIEIKPLRPVKSAPKRVLD